MKLVNLQNLLKEKRINVFSTGNLEMLLGVSEAAAYRLLWNYEKRGFVVKLKKGLYALKSDFPGSYLIANRLCQPSYISFDTAMSHYGIIPETIYAVTSATSKITRSFEVEGVLYDYHRIKKEAYTGYRPLKYRGAVVLMAEPEKAIADYLYFVDIKKRGVHYERMNLKKVKRGRLISYARLFDRRGMTNLVDKIYADCRKSQ